MRTYDEVVEQLDKLPPGGPGDEYQEGVNDTLLWVLTLYSHGPLEDWGAEI